MLAILSPAKSLNTNLSVSYSNTTTGSSNKRRNLRSDEVGIRACESHEVIGQAVSP